MAHNTFTKNTPLTKTCLGVGFEMIQWFIHIFSERNKFGICM